MRVRIATASGAADRPNEDRALADGRMVVVVDGLTARTGTGCRHGVAWFADRLARDILGFSDRAPAEALRAGIGRTASRHADRCDLTDPATPCTAVAVVGVAGPRLRYAVLGDVTVVVPSATGPPTVVSDPRMAGAARAEKDEATALPFGSGARAAALVRMKRVEIGLRNTARGYWIAGSLPAAADRAVTGELDRAGTTGLAVLTDGAARLVDEFGTLDWAGAVAVLGSHGPEGLIDRVREVERTDPTATRWPRTKMSDDATVAYCTDLDT